MPWNTPTAMSLRRELVLLASQPDANVAELARCYGVSRKTAYKWIGRYHEGGPDALADRPRTPERSPQKTPPEIEKAVLRVREAHPRWGGRKIQAVLLRQGLPAPSPATITAILRRHGRLSPEPRPRQAMTRFEAEAPNDLWQMDHKGDFLLGDDTRCFPLTVLDDHSRFSLCIDGQTDQKRGPVQARLISVFERYGLPRRLLCDNGRPWGSGWRRTDEDGRAWPHYTRLAAWAMQFGITVTHCRPYHPQTQGKEERFHRTLREEVLDSAAGGAAFADLAACQGAFDAWRAVYNQERPHDALGLAVPADRYRVSKRAYPERLPSAEYDEGTEVRSVDVEGRISFLGHRFRVGKAFAGCRVGLIAGERDGSWRVHYCHQQVWLVDLDTKSYL